MFGTLVAMECWLTVHYRNLIRTKESFARCVSALLIHVFDGFGHCRYTYICVAELSAVPSVFNATNVTNDCSTATLHAARVSHCPILLKEQPIGVSMKAGGRSWKADVEVLGFMGDGGLFCVRSAT